MIFKRIPKKNIFKNPVITIGSFDGVHTGHRKILSTLMEIAGQKSGDPIVLTFSVHPRKILSPHTPPRILTTISEKIEAIKKFGIDKIIAIDFTEEIANMPAEDFYNKYILEKIGIVDIVVGYDNAFGKDREGNYEYLTALSRKEGFSVYRVDPENNHSRPVSSTWIRTEIEDGYITMANMLLGRRYTLTGSVVKGDGMGRKIGFPTANIIPDDLDKVIPRDGVYAVAVTLKRKTYPGMLNIGTNPTFSKTERSIEVNIFDLNRDLYGKSLHLEFYDRIRDEVLYESPERLIAQLNKDKKIAMEILNKK